MAHKLSKYNFEVEHEKHVLLYNGLSDKLLPVTYEEFSVLETLLEHLPEFEKTYPLLYNELQESGFVIDEDFDELEHIKLQNKKVIYSNRDYHITINPTLDCNLKCWYCSVDYAGTQHDNGSMTETTIEALKNHLRNILVPKRADSLSLDWFGGEPTLFYDDIIRPVSLEIMRDAEKYGVHFRQQITTNCTLLNESRIREMRDFKFDFFQISTDGSEKHHNRIKHFHDKTGTYKRVFENINLITELLPNATVVLRINFDKQTLKSVTDVINDLSDTSKKMVRVDFQRVWQVPMNDEDILLLREAKERFGQEGLFADYGIFRPRSFKRCYADNHNHYVINYNGKVFKCTARDYSDKMLLGTLLPSGTIRWNEKLMSKYFSRATFENEMCEACKMLPLCMGPCIQKAYEARKGEEMPNCVLNNTEVDINTFIINMAQLRGLI